MTSDHGSGTFPIEIEITYEQFFFRFFQFLPVRSINSTSQSEFSIVCNFNAFVKIARFDNCQYWTKYFLLGNSSSWLYISNNGRSDIITISSNFITPGQEISFLPANINVLQNIPFSIQVNNTTHRIIFFGRANF